MVGGVAPGHVSTGRTRLGTKGSTRSKQRGIRTVFLLRKAGEFGGTGARGHSRHSQLEHAWLLTIIAPGDNVGYLKNR